MSTEIAGASVRRVPRQDRSEQRFELILDTTAALIDEVGYGSLTTSLIAKRVGMSGPGIYRYFDGLQAIATALATRNLRRLLERAAELTSDTTLEWDQAMHGLVGVYCDMFRTEPGFRWLRLGDAIDRHLIDDTETNRTVVARYMADHFVERYDVYPRPDLLQHVEVWSRSPTASSQGRSWPTPTATSSTSPRPRGCSPATSASTWRAPSKRPSGCTACAPSGSASPAATSAALPLSGKRPCYMVGA
jgi:AcrR family transcriptional regulator